MSDHVYLSTSCLHGQHGYCQSVSGEAGPKEPAKCKFCEARCICHCHHEAEDSECWRCYFKMERPADIEDSE